MTDYPRVSAIMPTRNRARFAEHAIEQFLQQDYPNKELCIVDDANGDLFRFVAQTVGRGHALSYTCLFENAPIGAKRNHAIKWSHGDIILHFDDDDWHSPNRISSQVAALGDADLCGLSTLHYLDITTGQAWRYGGPHTGERWLAGGSLCYRRALWERQPFPDISIGEDVTWLDSLSDVPHVEADPFCLIAITHPGNTSPRRIEWGGDWTSIPPESLRAHMGADWDFYQPEERQRQQVASTPIVPART